MGETILGQKKIFGNKIPMKSNARIHHILIVMWLPKQRIRTLQGVSVKPSFGMENKL